MVWLLEKLIKKGKKDIEYFQQVLEELVSSKKLNGMTSYGTQEFNDMMEDRKHGANGPTREQEMKIYQEIRNVKETREMYIAPSIEPRPRINWHICDQNPDTKWKRSRYLSFVSSLFFMVLFHLIYIIFFC